jgi:uncharacterized protein YPO0396
LSASIEYREQAARLEHLQRMVDAADSFFRQKSIDIFTPARAALKADLEGVVVTKKHLDEQIADKREECRHLQNEIDQAGGERLQQIPFLIQNHQSQASTKRENSRRYHDALREAGIREDVSDQATFVVVRNETPSLLREVSLKIASNSDKRDTLLLECSGIRAALRDDESELNALAKRQGNLPEWMAVLRRNLCADLRMPEKDLPFAAEVISVKPEERAWESSIEMVLHSFALSLLVPQRHYHIVSQYVDAKRVPARLAGWRRRFLSKTHSFAPNPGCR